MRQQWGQRGAQQRLAGRARWLQRVQQQLLLAGRGTLLPAVAVVALLLLLAERGTLLLLVVAAALLLRLVGRGRWR